MKVKTNDLKKGTRIQLRNGWAATLTDSRKGNIREAKVYGTFTEIGSVYAHDIMWAEIDGVMVEVEHTPAQLKCKQMSDAFFRPG